MTSPHPIAEAVLLAVVVLSCWIGVLGMLRMPTPTAALHFVAFPATAGATALVIALFVHAGSTVVAWKTVLIALVLFASNSVVAHATARAFRARDVGHWEPLDGDPFERFPRTPQPPAANAGAPQP